jgi:predicted nucleic acid-binding protein
MTARFFADTNIAVYSLDEDSDKRQRCFEILRRRPVISVQVVNEFLSVLL